MSDRHELEAMEEHQRIVETLAASIKSIANDLMDEEEGPLPLIELARRLVARGVTVKDPS